MIPPTSSAYRGLDRENPWPGLESFHEADQAFFNGREADTAELLRLVQGGRLTVLYGVSGLGKSSLLQAGLFHLLREKRMLPAYVRLVHGEDAPPHRVQVLDALRGALAGRGLEVPEFDPALTLWENFHRRGARIWTADHLPVIPVLVLDQFEEAFPRQGRWTGALAGDTTAFLRELADLVEGRVPPEVRARMDADPRAGEELVFGQHPYRVVISLREDFLADLEALRPIMPSLASGRMRLLPLSGAAALRVTAAGGEALVPPQVGELIVRLVSANPDEALPVEERTVDPALLSLFCRELNELRKAQRLPSLTREMVTANRESILENFYSRSLKGLPRAVRVLVEDRLLTKSGGFRDSEALVNVLGRRGVTQEAIDTLVERRLIRVEERGGITRMELTHDVLTGVVRESRDRRRFSRQVVQLLSVAAVLVLLLAGVAALALGAKRQEREALLERELTTELLREDMERARRDAATDSAVAMIKEAALRRAAAAGTP